jgi:hypothetical protein
VTSSGFDHAYLEVNELRLDVTTKSPEEITKIVFDVTSSLFRDDRQISQCFIMLATRPRVALLHVSPRNVSHQTKSGVAVGVREIAVKFEAKLLYAVSEAWKSTVARKEDEPPKIPKLEPRHDPNREEVVAITIEDPAAVPPMSMWIAKIDRKHGRPKLLEWTHLSATAKELFGRLMYLLPPEAYGKRVDA